MRRLSWASVAVLAICCAVLGLLQYRWIGEIGDAERDRLRESLRTRLNAFSRAFDNEVSEAATRLVPSQGEMDRLGREEAWRARYTTNPLFRAAAVEWEGGGVHLSSSVPAPNALRIEVYGQPFGPEWLLLDLDSEYLRREFVPRLLNLYLADEGDTVYDAAISTNTNPSRILYGSSESIRQHADASVPLLNIRLGGFGRGGRGGGPPGPPPGGPGGPGGRRGPPPGGRRGGRGGPPPNTNAPWQLSVRHHAGSLEALVSGTQRRNLAVSGGVLLLILAAAGLLLHLSRQAQRLADLQMEFVAGVSHELRTPLTVIRTAAYNLRGSALRGRPEHVERYGRLIESESSRLESLMEQVLRFASLRSGQTLRAREPVSLTALAKEELELRDTDFVIEQRLDDPMPPVAGDPAALRHAVRNLIDNALKHGARGRWLGVYGVRGEGWVELRVADRGPGIPHSEQSKVFDAFWRGSGALRDQVHGTGLGLNLVRTIVKAHGGSVRVQSEEGNGAEFIVRLPEYRNEDAHSAG